MYITANNQTLATSGSSAGTIASTGGGTVRYGTTKNDTFHSIKNDTLAGGLGDDVYNLWDAGSKVSEKAGEGIDTVNVQYWGGYTLDANVENAFLVSAGATWATGNALNNILVAGKSGATLNGGAGDDVLVGGAGADIFVVAAGNGSDAIDNFKSGWDTIKLQGYAFTTWNDVKAAATQVGADVAIKLSATEKLVIHGVQLSSLQASDFNMVSQPTTLSVAKVATQSLSTAGSAWNANGWYVVNNAWGSGALTNGKDYTLTSSYTTANMTKGTTFAWHYDVNTNNSTAPAILAFPEVIFGASPLGASVNPTDTAHVFPIKLSDIAGLTAQHDVSFGGNVGGFDVAYDIFFSNSQTATGKAAVSNEVMIWLHKGSFEAFGDLIGTYSNGAFTAKIYHTGTYTAVVADGDVAAGTLDLADIFSKLKGMGILTGGEYLRSVELGAEVTGGTGSLTINDLGLTVQTKNASGGITTKTVTGAGTGVVDQSAADLALAKTYVAGTQKIVDAFGFAAGTATTTVDAQGNATVTRTDAAGRSLGRDVVTHDAKSITVQHYTGANVLAGIDVSSFDGSAETRQHFDASWKLIGADRISTSATGASVVEHYDANWKLVSVDQTIAKSAGVVEYQHYDASWKIVSSDIVTTAGDTVTTQHMGANWAYLGTDQVKHNADGSTTVQHFGSNYQMTGADLIKVANGATTTYHYDAKYVLTGSDVTTVDNAGVSKMVSYDGAYRQTGTGYTGTDRADTLTGGSGETHFHGGLGSDTMTGGSGADFFHLDTAIGQGDVDTIKSFSVAKDKIVLDHAIFDTLGKIGALDASMFVVGTKALDANDHLIFDKAKGDLYYDADGNGAHAPVLLAHVGADAVLTAGNFVIG